MNKGLLMRELEGTVAWVERRLHHNRPDLQEDLLQEGRKAALESLSTYDPGADCSRKTWAAKYAHRDMVRLLNKEYEHFVDIDDLLEQDGIDELLDVAAPLHMEDSVDVEHMLIHLTHPERTVVLYYVFHDWSFEKIGKQLSYSKQYVNRLWHSAVAKLQQQFG